MQDKLKTLLEQINFDNNLFVFFNDGRLSKIVGNKEKTKYNFYISLIETLPIDIYTNFIDALKKHFKNYKVKVSFTVDKQNNELIKDYYQYLIKKNIEEFPLLETFLDNDINYENNTLTIEVANKAEQMKLESISDKLVGLLDSVGYDTVNINVIVNEAKSEEIRKEIEQAKTVEVKPEKKEIIEIVGGYIPKVTHEIGGIFSEEDNVSLEAYVFGIDIFESSKSNFKIFTFKITDFNDSMYAKLFVKEQSDFDFYKKHIKNNAWYKFRGYTKFDKYSNEIVLNIRDINKKIDTANSLDCCAGNMACRVPTLFEGIEDNN